MSSFVTFPADSTSKMGCFGLCDTKDETELLPRTEALVEGVHPELRKVLTLLETRDRAEQVDHVASLTPRVWIKIRAGMLLMVEGVLYVFRRAYIGMARCVLQFEETVGCDHIHGG